MDLQWVSVQSSNLQAVAYDADSRKLHVRFKPSGYYVYSGVPMSVYEGILSAPSKGRYFDVKVKKAGYSYDRVR